MVHDPGNLMNKLRDARIAIIKAIDSKAIFIGGIHVGNTSQHLEVVKVGRWEIRRDHSTYPRRHKDSPIRWKIADEIDEILYAARRAEIDEESKGRRLAKLQSKVKILEEDRHDTRTNKTGRSGACEDAGEERLQSGSTLSSIGHHQQVEGGRARCREHESHPSG